MLVGDSRASFHLSMKLNDSVAIVGSFASALFVAVIHLTCSVRFQRSPAFNNLTCTENETVFSEPVASVAGCTAFCAATPLCYSLFYSQELQLCRGCSTMYWNREQLTLNPDYRHYNFTQGKKYILLVSFKLSYFRTSWGR